MSFQLKEGMTLGVASAATQIEGGDTGHNWNDWYRRGKIKDGSDPARADDHYRRWKEDADLMAVMGIRAYRLGVEWSRLEPEEGVFDREAVLHYRRELRYLKKLGIEPLLTIHHFTNPMWFEKKGAFSRMENSRYYLRLVRLCVRYFGDLVSEYITINEPDVYAVNSWFFGDWPPGEKSLVKTMDVMSVMAYCHIKAYETIHRMRAAMGYEDTKVSFANHLRVFEPKNPKNPAHRFSAWGADWLFQGAMTVAMCCGRFLPPMRNLGHVPEGEYCDFQALNYYARSTVSGLRDGVMEHAPVNDLGWEIYPEGIVQCARRLYEILPRPIYITENGTCDNRDVFRCRYLYDHLKALCDSDLPVERYYHWCFCDNLEWLEGQSARFGLVHVDYETQKRTVKKSGQFYCAMIAEGGVDDSLYEEYVAGETYRIGKEPERSGFLAREPREPEKAAEG